MKNIRVFLSDIFFQFFEVKFSIYLNRGVFDMDVILMGTLNIPLFYRRS